MYSSLQRRYARTRASKFPPRRLDKTLLKSVKKPRYLSGLFLLGARVVSKALLHDVRVVGQFTRGGIEGHPVEVLGAVVNLKKDVHGKFGAFSVIGT